MQINNSLESITNFFSIYKERLNAEILTGDYSLSLEKAINNYSPSGKVAFICFEKSFNIFAKKISDISKKCNIESVNVLLKEEEISSVEQVYGLFNLPDDVRLVIFVDSELSQIASYFAYLRKIPLLYIVTEIMSESFFPEKAYFKNGDKFDFYKVYPKRIILIDSDLITDVSQGYADVTSKITALLDYRISLAISDSVVDNQIDLSYQMVKEAINDTFKISSPKEKLQILFNAIKISVANALVSGDIFESSSAINAKKLYGDKSSDIELQAFFEIISLYASVKNTFVGSIVDYNNKASELSLLTDLEESQFIKNYIIQAKKIANKKMQLLNVIRHISSEAKENVRALSVIKNNYQKLGGVFKEVSLQNLKTCVKYSGDVSQVNYMSILRENGITELM